ncbi:hypothetical protein [Neobacillus dielmonensis]|uniref:hypothetical protein n=1 Tax=Neobacillus dielmonensis TaxID=1347369 RepID=UPI0005A83C8C|nr:hypothetical protein [Neobacillus dielmonensis]
MNLFIQIVSGILVGGVFFYITAIERIKPLKYLLQHINSTLFYFAVAVLISAVCFIFLPKLKVFGLAASITMVILFIILYIAFHSGGIGF